MLWRRADWEMQEHEEGGTYYRAHGKGDPPQRGRDLLAYVAVKITDQPAAHLDCRFFAAETAATAFSASTLLRLPPGPLPRPRPACRRSATTPSSLISALGPRRHTVREGRPEVRPAFPCSGPPRSPTTLLAAFTTAGVRRRLEHAIARQLIGEDDDTFPGLERIPKLPGAEAVRCRRLQHLSEIGNHTPHRAHRLKSALYSSINHHNMCVFP